MTLLSVLLTNEVQWLICNNSKIKDKKNNQNQYNKKGSQLDDHLAKI